MKFMIYFLIIFFIILIMYQIYQMHFYNNRVEGLANNTTGQYQSYNTATSSDPTNVAILAQQNAGNIQVLEGQIGNFQGLQTEVNDISGNMVNISTQINALQQQMNALTQQQQSAAANINQKLPVSGAT